MASAAKFFNNDQKIAIEEAIGKAELNTSGEIRVHIENNCKGDVLQTAVAVFKKLKMHETELRNAVLFYLAIKDRKFAIYGDKGIHELVPENFWNDVKEKMSEQFQSGRFTEGLCAGIEMAGLHLKSNFPHQINDKNELSNDISFGG